MQLVCTSSVIFRRSVKVVLEQTVSLTATICLTKEDLIHIVANDNVNKIDAVTG